ncbi:YwdI family protein [Neobacillus sp. D3-1R]|uniref:YwdI family protein n=1 Tax=Neobacillus sp. D3-1R TaxID=3445778 RepID=UPI003F9F2348
MDISVNQLLKKMEKELQKAKLLESSSKVRESIHSIKILCELILEENDREISSFSQPVVAPPKPQISQVLTTTSLPSKKLDMDEEANGDSLFDF